MEISSPKFPEAGVRVALGIVYPSDCRSAFDRGRLFRARTYPELLVQALAGAFAYRIGVLWPFFAREPAGVRLRLRIAEYLQQSLDR